MASNINHPTEEALERFLLHQSQGPELETIETHILACESCVQTLENLEDQIAVTKAALSELQREAKNDQSETQKRPFRGWFSVPALSWAAGAVAAAALCIAALTPAQVTLTANRGIETSFAPEWRPLDVHLSANDLADGAVAVQLVNGEGGEIWSGAALVRNELLEVHLPRVTKKGSYFLRLYESGTKNEPRGELLREFAFQVR